VGGRLVALIDKKIAQLERFNEITALMLYEDVDGMEHLLDERDKIVRAVDGISVDIKQYISEQSMERQTQIKAVFRFQDISDLNDELLELQEKIKELERLKSLVRDADKKAYNRLRALQDELTDEMGEAFKSKQVANYFSQTAIDLSKGSKFNVSN
jgi:predicted  nucleic acid-binding Zn-ribbon protein